MDSIHHVLPEGEGTATTSVDADELAPHVEFRSNETRGHVRRLEVDDVASLVKRHEVVIAGRGAAIWARVMALGVDARNQILAEVAKRKTDEEIKDKTIETHELARTPDEICHNLIVQPLSAALLQAQKLQDDELVDVLPELNVLDPKRYAEIIGGLPPDRVADLALNMPEILHSAVLTTLPVDLAVAILERAAHGDAAAPALIGDLIAQDHPQAIFIFAGLHEMTVRALLNVRRKSAAQAVQDEASATLGHWLAMHRVEIEAAREEVKRLLRTAQEARDRDAKKALRGTEAKLDQAPDIDVTDDDKNKDKKKQ